MYVKHAEEDGCELLRRFHIHGWESDDVKGEADSAELNGCGSPAIH
jgi:hypothetical protein